MAEVQEAHLPGLGVRHEFVTAAGDRIGVLTHKTGWRDLLLYDRQDPDACTSVRLEEDDARTLADLLGAARIAEQLAAMQQQVEGIAIDWLTLPAGSTLAGATLAESGVRRRMGVTVVAVIRGDDQIPVPGPDFELRGGDVAVVIGRHDGIAALKESLQG